MPRLSPQCRIQSQPSKIMQKRNRMPVSDKRKPLGSSFYTRSQNDKRKKFNVYATTRDGCETKLAEMIEYVKVEIAEKKPKIEKSESDP